MAKRKANIAGTRTPWISFGNDTMKIIEVTIGGEKFIILVLILLNSVTLKIKAVQRHVGRGASLLLTHGGGIGDVHWIIGLQ